MKTTKIKIIELDEQDILKILLECVSEKSFTKKENPETEIILGLNIKPGYTETFQNFGCNDPDDYMDDIYRSAELLGANIKYKLNGNIINDYNIDTDELLKLILSKLPFKPSKKKPVNYKIDYNKDIVSIEFKQKKKC